MRRFAAPARPCYLFLPGTHSTSSAPLSLAARAATKRKSDSRLMYFIASVDVFAGPARQFHHQSFGATCHGAGEVQCGRGRRATRQHEGAQRRKILVEPSMSRLKPRRPGLTRFAAARTPPFSPCPAWRDRRRDRTDRSGSHQHRVEIGESEVCSACHADAGIGLVDGAIGRDPRSDFSRRAPPTSAGRAVIAGAGVDPVQDDHAFSPFAGVRSTYRARP
jgi:hypothetical protein